jgi:carbamoyltransferase
MELLHSVPSYHSPGYYYNYVTHLLGFTPLRHEGKITGLAAYGSPDRALPLFRERLVYDTQKFSFVNRGRWMTEECKYLEPRLAEFSREDVAAAVQRNTEDVVAAYVRDAAGRTGARRLVLSGGVFSNVRLNQVVWNRSEVDDVYVYPHMGDGGLAAGAALQAYHAHNPSPDGAYEPVEVAHAYLGPSYGEYEIERIFARYSELRVDRPPEMARAVAQLLAKDKVVARFDGAMEYGPRALGNRSVLCHAKDPHVNDWLNQRLNRTEFMPFAPVTTDEAAPRYFQRYDADRARAARFMTLTYDVTERCVAEAPAIVHVDRTARPQVVRRRGNPGYYDILLEYGRITGSPLLVNTTYHMHEEPNVDEPAVAVRSCRRGGLDALAIGPFLVTAAT